MFATREKLAARLKVQLEFLSYAFSIDDHSTRLERVAELVDNVNRLYEQLGEI